MNGSIEPSWASWGCQPQPSGHLTSSDNGQWAPSSPGPMGPMGFIKLLGPVGSLGPPRILMGPFLYPGCRPLSRGTTLLAFEAPQTRVYSLLKGLYPARYSALLKSSPAPSTGRGRGVPPKSCEIWAFARLGRREPIRQEKYSHSVWEHLPHPENPILGTSFSDLL